MRNFLKPAVILATIVMAVPCGLAGAQDAKAGGAPAVQSADAAPPAPRARKRHARPTMAAPACDKVSDPWGDLCQIRKNAETACSDVAAPAPPKVRTGRKTRKPAAPEPQMPNQRQECVDAYMGNV